MRPLYLLALLSCVGCKSSSSSNADLSMAQPDLAEVVDAAPPDLRPGPFKQIAIVGAPSSTLADAFLPDIRVQTQDLNGTPVRSSVMITLTLTSSNGAVLHSVLPQSTSNTSEVTFSLLWIDKAGTGYVLTASTTNLNADSAPFDTHESFTPLTNGLATTQRFGSALVAPNDSNTVYLADATSIYKSSDAGAHWAQSSAQYTPNLVADGANYIYSDTSQRQLSTDSTWAALSWMGRQLQFSRAAPSNAFALADGNSFYYSTTGAPPWTTVTTGLMFATVNGTLAFFVDPTTSGASATIYETYYNYPSPVSTIQVSRDRGGTWTAVSPCATTEVIQSFIGTDGALFVSCGGTTRRTTDYGATWTNCKFAAGYANGMAFHPTNHMVVYASNAQYGVFRSDDAGLNFKNVGLLHLVAGTNLGAGGPLAVDPNNVNVVYFATQGYGVYKTTTGGL